MIIIAGPINFVGQGHVAQIVADAVLLAGLGALGVRALSMADEEWEAPRERPAVAAGQPEPESVPVTA